jgi:mannose-6-phosphate isomerase-like protein (cupin superfamily)
MQPIDRNSAEHYIWGKICDGWHFLSRPELSILAERVPADAAEMRHYHSKSRQFFYILSGKATIEIEGQCIELTEGQGVEVNPGARHQFMNRSTEDVHFLVISNPATKGDRVDV